MKLILLLLQIAIINCSFVNETSYKIKYILNKCARQRRCDENSKVENFLSKTLDFVDRTERFGDVLKYFNTSECVSDRNSTNVKRHILNGLLIHHDLPHSHWLEYKSVFNKEYRSRHHELSAISRWRENLRLVAEHNRRFLAGETTYSLHLNQFGDWIYKAYRSRHHELSALSRWRENLRLVAEHNRRFLAGETTYSLHLNQFGDWDTKDYFTKILKLFDTGPLFDPAEDKRKTTYVRNARRKVPSRMDWRALGFKPKREEQWRCGACYAFAVTHALQAQLYKKHGDWGELSPQQIVDCSSADGNMGCNGGSLRGAMRYTARAGLIAEKRYPYTGKKGSCKSGSSLVRTRPKRWAMLPAGDEAAMEKALATIGPLAVAVNAAPFTFQLYRSGIYDDPFCFPWHLNHAMLLVGYTPQYWILLNWWGRQWGEDGYIRIRRGHNRCGVANMAAYVEL